MVGHRVAGSECPGGARRRACSGLPTRHRAPWPSGCGAVGERFAVVVAYQHGARVAGYSAGFSGASPYEVAGRCADLGRQGGRLNVVRFGVEIPLKSAGQGCDHISTDGPEGERQWKGDKPCDAQTTHYTPPDATVTVTQTGTQETTDDGLSHTDRRTEGGAAKYCTGGSELGRDDVRRAGVQDRKSTRLNSSHVAISYAVFCLKKNT